MANKIQELHDVIYKDSAYGDITKIFYVVEDVQFGIDTKNTWLQLINNPHKDINRLENNLALYSEFNDGLLSLLEISIKNFKEGLAGALRTNKFSALLAETFPYELVILNGLYSDSDWWVELALDWLMHLPTKDKYNYKPLIYLIDKIANNKAYSQNIRHKAKRAISKIYHK